MSRENVALPRMIFLVGFMGVGKTTVGRRLAEILGLGFMDLDDQIERRSGRTVREIFSSEGEPRFRELEGEAIRSCAALTDTVVALGGGAYVREENRNTLRSIGKTIWLDCPLSICLARIAADGSRPLAADEAAMQALLKSRLPAYALADYRVEAGEQGPDQVARKIVEVLRGEGVL